MKLFDRGDYAGATRALMGAIRGGWTVVFMGAGFAVSYVADQFSGLPFDSPWTGVVIGALCYGIKRAVWPDGTF